MRHPQALAMEWKLSGYRRSNGTVGVRNHVAVLAAEDNVNPLARELSDRPPGQRLFARALDADSWTTTSIWRFA